MKKLFLFCSSLLTIISHSIGQEVWSADIQIKSASIINMPDHYKASFVIFNHWDDDARNVKAVFVIPYGAKVLSVTKGCTISPTVAPMISNGVVHCALGNMGVRAEKLIEIKINKILTRGRPIYYFHGFVCSESPDPDPVNNVKLLKVE